jgi:hypothetical protein
MMIKTTHIIIKATTQKDQELPSLTKEFNLMTIPVLVVY